MRKVSKTAVSTLAWSPQPPWRLAAAISDTGIQACGGVWETGHDRHVMMHLPIMLHHRPFDRRSRPSCAALATLCVFFHL